jgi:hypothetical protein
MFDNVQARFYARAIFVGALAFLISLKASLLGSDLTPSEVYNALLDWGITSLTYAGIAPFSKILEPNIGPRKREGG